jgi:hypothetical protein
MNVRFSMTKRMAEMAGFSEDVVEVEDDATLEAALGVLARGLSARGARQLLRGDQLHPSVLVILRGQACATHERNLVLGADETVELLLPIAGG